VDQATWIHHPVDKVQCESAKVLSSRKKQVDPLRLIHPTDHSVDRTFIAQPLDALSTDFSRYKYYFYFCPLIFKLE